MRGASLSRGGDPAGRPAHRHRLPKQLSRLHPQRDEVSGRRRYDGELARGGFQVLDRRDAAGYRQSAGRTRRDGALRTTPGAAGSRMPAVRRARRSRAGCGSGPVLGECLLRRRPRFQPLSLPAAGTEPGRRDTARCPDELPRYRSPGGAGALGTSVRPPDPGRRHRHDLAGHDVPRRRGVGRYAGGHAAARPDDARRPPLRAARRLPQRLRDVLAEGDA